MRIQAFRGLLPRPELAAEVAAVPYDVVDTEEARALATGRPYDLLHVDRAEIDLPADTNPYSPLVYETAAKNLQKLIADGILQREAEPALYLYQQVMDGRAQTGLIAFVGLASPHLVRSMVQTTPRYLVVLSSLMGAVLLLAADTLARWLIAPQELPVGVLTAVLGGGYLLWLMHRRNSPRGGL